MKSELIDDCDFIDINVIRKDNQKRALEAVRSVRDNLEFGSSQSLDNLDELLGDNHLGEGATGSPTQTDEFGGEDEKASEQAVKKLRKMKRQQWRQERKTKRAKELRARESERREDPRNLDLSSSEFDEPFFQFGLRIIV